MTGYIYAVECMGRVKIGFSEWPAHRFNKIASDSPAPCTLLGYWPGSVKDEAEVHRQFADVRVHGEWFAATQALLQYVGVRVSGSAPAQSKAEPATRVARSSHRPVRPIQSPKVTALMVLGELYGAAQGIGQSTVSWRVFGDNSKLAALHTGADIGVRRLEKAVAWFSANWPDGVVWPTSIDRPAADQALMEALEKAGGAVGIGRLLGISSQAVSQWDKVPASRVLEVERATGISRHTLRPDIFGEAEPADKGTAA